MIRYWGATTAMALFPGFGLEVIAVLASVAVVWGRLAAWMDRRDAED